jgi:hypothetical protein
MTTREKLMQAVLDLPDDKVPGALEYVAARLENGADKEPAKPSDIIDDWGNLDTFGTALMGDALRHLDEEETAEFGETISEAWGDESAK